MKGDAVDDPVECVGRGDVVLALNEVNAEKNPEPSDVSLELIAALRQMVIEVMFELYQNVLVDWECQLNGL